MIAQWIAFAILLSTLPALATERAHLPRSVLELSPLKGALGQLAVRGEVVVAKSLHLGISAEHTQAASERRDYTDRSQNLSTEVLWYASAVRPVFLAGGLAIERSDIGRQDVRDGQTWMRIPSDQMHDRWANEDTYVSATQSIGYRVFAGEWLTASVRWVRDQLLSSSSRVRKDEVYSQEIDLASRGRDAVRHSLLVYCGLALP